ncbi:MAG: hypothetical protein PHH14_03165 [Candidatus Margulisbacteria bacterium]|nr:hypothetical protein [Candidatus Margulisiibacteriota bacterium]
MDISLIVNWPVHSSLAVSFISFLLIILVGYLLARGLGWLITAVLKMIQFDKLLKQIGFSGLLEKGDVKKSASELVGNGLYWLIILATIYLAAVSLRLPIEPALSRLFVYLGMIAIAAIVLGIGLFFASLFAGVVKLIALNFGIEGGKTLARVVYLLVVIFATLAALAQLGVKPSIFLTKLDVLIGAPALAAAIAFGLGCKDMAADFLHNLFKGK